MCISALVQWSYGIGEMAVVAPIAVSVFFLLFFLTEVVGLSLDKRVVSCCWGDFGTPLTIR